MNRKLHSTLALRSVSIFTTSLSRYGNEENRRAVSNLMMDLAQQAMRFPSNAYRKELGTLDEMMEEEKKMAKDIMNGDLGDDDDDMGFD